MTSRLLEESQVSIWEPGAASGTHTTVRSESVCPDKLCAQQIAHSCEVTSSTSALIQKPEKVLRFSHAWQEQFRPVQRKPEQTLGDCRKLEQSRGSSVESRRYP